MSGPARLKTFLAFLACFAGFASAHVSSGVTRLYHGVQGPYEVWVTSRSGVPVVGLHHLSVTVLQADTKAAVPDAEVSLTFTSPGGHSRTYDAVSRKGRYFFETDALLAQPGRWRLSLGVQSAWGREAAVTSLRLFTPFQLGLSLTLIITALVAVMALVGFGRFSGLRRLVKADVPKREVERRL